MKTLFPEFPKEITDASLNRLFGDLTSFLSPTNAIDEKDLPAFKKKFRQFNERVGRMLVAVGGEITNQISAQYNKDESRLHQRILRALNANRLRQKLLRQHRMDASTSLFFLQAVTAGYIENLERTNSILKRKSLDLDALVEVQASQMEQLQMMLSAFSDDGAGDKNVKAVAEAIKHKNMDALLRNAHSLVSVVEKSAHKLSGKFPNLAPLALSLSLLLPLPMGAMAKDEKGGGMTTEEAFKTAVKVFLITNALYLIGYFVFVAFHFTPSVTIGKFLVRTLHLYPNRFIEDLAIEHIEDMSRTILYLCAIFIPVALYRKIKKQS